MQYRIFLNRFVMVCLLLTLALGLPGLLQGASTKKGAATSDEKDSVLARMGDVSLTVAEFQLLMHYSNKEVKQQLLANPELLKQKIRESVLRKAILSEAHASKWDSRPEVLFLMQRAKEGILVEQFLDHEAKLPAGFPEDALVRKVYQENQDILQTPPAVYIAQIFLGFEPNASDQTKQDLKKSAEKWVAMIKKGEADFAALAKKHSQHQPSAAQGGDMGWVEVTQLLPEFKKAIEGGKAGEIKGPLESAQGIHIIKLIASREAATKSYEEARDALRQLLINKKLQENKDLYLKEMVDKHPFSIDEENLSQLK